MLGKTYEAENCSAARTLELVGERWSLLILRNALFAGATRFREFEQSLGVAPNILKARLDGFVDAGLMVRHRYSKHPEHYEYLLTDKGRDFLPVVLALIAWGDRWAAPDGPPVLFEHIPCGSPVQSQVRCAACGQVHNTDVATRPGPGATMEF
jgi:DNA-binding HxlR family transcriptional regulator